MATSLTVTNILFQLGWDYESTTSWGSNNANVSKFVYNPTNLTNGTGAGKAQVLWVTTLTIGANTTSTFDLNTTTGSGFTVDPFNTNNNFTKVVGMFVQHKTPAATGTLEISGSWFTNTATSSPIVIGGTSPTAKLIVRPGGCFALFCTDGTGYTVTDATADVLTFKNNDAASVSVNVALVGQ